MDAQNSTLPFYQRIILYVDFLRVINFSNNLLVPRSKYQQRQQLYKVYVARGNNGVLVKSLFQKNRWWWHVQDYAEEGVPPDANLIWSQERSNQVYKLLLKIQNITDRKCSFRTMKLPSEQIVDSCNFYEPDHIEERQGETQGSQPSDSHFLPDGEGDSHDRAAETQGDQAIEPGNKGEGEVLGTTGKSFRKSEARKKRAEISYHISLRSE